MILNSDISNFNFSAISLILSSSPIKTGMISFSLTASITDKIGNSLQAFTNAASRAYKQKEDGNEPYWDKEDQEWGLDKDIFEHHPVVHQSVDQIWQLYKPHFEQALGVEVKDYNNCYVHAFQCGDSSWTHQDYMDYSAIVYFNPTSNWDLRKWGGET